MEGYFLPPRTADVLGVVLWYAWATTSLKLQRWLLRQSGRDFFGIGRKLLEAVIEAGRSSGARRLYLETNHSLTPAIRLYESLGFKQLAPEKVQASPYARADVYMEMILV